MYQKDKDLISNNLNINENDELTFAGISVNELASEFKTPLYVMDENSIRLRCKEYVEAI